MDYKLLTQCQVIPEALRLITKNQHNNCLTLSQGMNIFTLKDYCIAPFSGHLKMSTELSYSKYYIFFFFTQKHHYTYGTKCEG